MNPSTFKVAMDRKLRHRHRCASGLTLIELLVVGTIAVLAALFLPSAKGPECHT